jgi:hypothetical protein
MTDTNCWLTYKQRPVKSVNTETGVNESPGSDRAKTDLTSVKFPSVFRNGWYWTSELRSWCKSVGISCNSEDGGTLISVQVTKPQVEAFIAFVYDADPDFMDTGQTPLRPERVRQLTELKADVAQDMDPDAIHGLRADEW